MIPPLFYNVGFTTISYGETNRSEDSCHWKDSLLLIVPERRAPTMARWALWRSGRASQEEKAEKGKCRGESRKGKMQTRTVTVASAGRSGRSGVSRPRTGSLD